MTSTNTEQPLLEWSDSKSRKRWQRHAVWLVVSGSVIDQSSIESLADMALEDHGWNEKSGIVAKRVLSKDFLSSDDESAPAKLEKLCHVTGINALKDDQVLRFNSDGLTIVYGRNGSGKSGYIRALKSISNSRGPLPKLLPNIHETSPSSPMIHLSCKEDGSQTDITYDLPIDKLDTLSGLKVFDESVGQSLLGSRNEVVYLPPQVRLFGEVSSVFERVKSFLEEMLGNYDTDISGLPSDLGEGPLGQLLTDLNSDANLKLLKTLSTHSSTEKKRFEELEPEFSATSKITRPTRIMNIQGQRERLQNYIASARRLELLVSDSELASLKLKFDSVKMAMLELQQSVQTTSTLPIRGIESTEWTAFWSSAGDFSDIAYPGHAFPVSDIGKHCLFCMQVLDATGSNNLKSLSNYASSILKTRVDSLSSEYGKLRANVQEEAELLAKPNTLRAELAASGNFLELSTYDSELRARVLAIPQLSASDWPDFAPLSDFEISSLIQLRTNLKERLTLIDSVKNSEDDDSTRAEFVELSLRHWASNNYSLIEQAVANLVKIKTIDEAVSSANTTSVTRATSSNAKQFAEKPLFDNLRIRLDQLKFEALHIEPVLEGRKGKLSQRMVLAEGAGVKLGDIASEGEFRAMAVATFLAENDMDPSSRTVIFDDPVRSLDHQYRRLMAKLLVELCAEKQVAVFTHDLVFLNELMRYCDELNVDVTAQSISSQGISKGIVADTMPWDDNTVKSRLGILRQEIQNFASKNSGKSDAEQNFALGVLFAMLREIWEDAVEQILLNSAITRFDPAIQTQRLRDLHDIEQKDLDEINTGMSVCSELMLGHSTPAASVPEPVDLKKIINEVARIDSWRKKNSIEEIVTPPSAP